MSPWSRRFRVLMMTSWNGNIFRVTGHLCGEFTGPRWIPHTKASDAELWCFLWSARISSWVNTREAGDLRRHRGHYDVIVMSSRYHWWSPSPCSLRCPVLLMIFPLQPAKQGTHHGTIDDLPRPSCVAGYSPRYHWWSPSRCNPPSCLAGYISTADLHPRTACGQDTHLGTIDGFPVQPAWQGTSAPLMIFYPCSLRGRVLTSLPLMICLQSAWQGTHPSTVDDLLPRAACVAGWVVTDAVATNRDEGHGITGTVAVTLQSQVWAVTIHKPGGQQTI